MKEEYNDNEERSDENMEKITISEATPVRIGLIIAFLGIFGSSIWWAASINSKLDSILASQNSFTTSTTSTITELKAKDMALSDDMAEIKLKQAMADVEIKALKEKNGIK